MLICVNVNRKYKYVNKKLLTLHQNIKKKCDGRKRNKK